MRALVSLSLMLVLIAGGGPQAAHAARSAPQGDSESILPFTIKFHAGLLVDSGDADIHRQWSHDPWYSYLFDIGFHYNLPFLWEGFYLFGGADVAYYVDEEEIKSGQASSFISSSYIQLLLTPGIGFQPASLGGFGFTLYRGIELWGQKNTDLDAQGFSRNLGTGKTRDPGPLGFTFYYLLDRAWRPYIGYERRSGNSVVLGVNYGF